MDKNTWIGFLLIAAIIVGFSFINRPSKEELAERQRVQDSIAMVRAQEVEAQLISEQIAAELEKANGRVTLQNGQLGQVVRGGEHQIEDWKKWIDSNFHKLKDFFDEERNQEKSLPLEFCEYDSTRIHYVVVGGTRDDYNDKTYEIRRRKLKETNILIILLPNRKDCHNEVLGYLFL